MLRKFVIILGYTFISCIFIAYFIFSQTLRVKDEKLEVCHSISVKILDSLENRFLTKKDVKDILISNEYNPINKKIQDININELETILDQRSAIKKSNVYTSKDGILHIDITQRKPVLRIETEKGGFYVDNEMYIFPLVKTFTSYVPIVTGNVPIKLIPNFRGDINKNEQDWLNRIMHIGAYIDKNEFWNSQIQEIYIENNLDICIYTRIGNQKICFGNSDDYIIKFKKLETFYKNIIPIYGWNYYSEVSLKFSDQIVCKKR